MADRLSILIAEDNSADRMLLSTIVSRQGHRVLTASNGLEAVALFEQERPHLVLMDALMPVMDGFEAARRIKQQAGDALVPIIFLTSLSENEALVRCLEAGGDDFLAKPYNRVILEAKIKAMDRLRRLQATVLHQRDVIAQHNEHLLREQRVAKEVFDRVAHSGCLNASNIRYLQSPYALFNGDLLLAAYTPSGGMHVMLGDFTGHGLPAAIGAMPLAEVFYGMTAKGHALAEILREINAKLKRILPLGVFCCATLLNINSKRGLLEVWNGGLPDGYLLHDDGRARQALVSRHLPLGILEPAAFSDRCEVYPLLRGDRILLLSDGVLEARNAQGNLFGESRLLEVLDCNQQARVLFDEIQQALVAFRGEQEDDVSMLQVGFEDEGEVLHPLAFADAGHNNPQDWSASFEFRAHSLRHFNPLPYLLQLLMDIKALRPRGGEIYTVLAELYSNALEHGVIGLDSALKRDARGFSEYYRERRLRLARLQDGYVRFHLQLCTQERGGRLMIRVEDSGPGFDAQALTSTSAGFSGRGLALVRELSDACHCEGEQPGVSVEFCWSTEA